NRSFPRGGRIRLEEDRILPDGRRERVRESDNHGYHPRERDFYRLAEARRDVAWTEPYRFFSGERGITCAMPLLDGAGAVRGVFTVDLSLDDLSKFVNQLRVSPRGRAFIAAGPSQIVAAPGGVDASGRVRWDDGALVGEVLSNLRESIVGAHVFDDAGKRFL